MQIWVHTDAYCLTELKSISQAGVYHYFGNKHKLPIQAYNPPPKHNHPLLVLSKDIDAVTSSAQESEKGGGYINAKESLPIRQRAIDMGHPQGPTQLQFENKFSHVILTGVPKQKQSKVMDMQFYWLHDRFIEQNKFPTHCKCGKQNLVYFPKIYICSTCSCKI